LGAAGTGSSNWCAGLLFPHVGFLYLPVTLGTPGELVEAVWGDRGFNYLPVTLGTPGGS
jgi:hypothetical protein